MKKTVLILLLITQTAFAGLTVTPHFVGNGVDDSVVISFCTFDTTYYPTITNADSVIALRFGADNSMVDSLTQSAANLFNPRTGWYEIHYRGSDNTGSEGIYHVYVRVKTGGDWRGAGIVAYQVIDDQVGSYLRMISADTDSIKDTLGVLLHSSDPIDVDSAQLARSVWNDDVVDKSIRRISHVDTADVVNAIPQAGGGAYACTLFVRETGSEVTVQGVFVRAMNSSETTTAAIGITDSNGRLLFSLDADTYHIFAYLGGYQFVSLPEMVTVTTSGATDTIWATAFDPGTPPSPSLCRVYGYVQSLGASGLDQAVVTARILTAPLLHEGVVISPYRVSTTTDSTGYWYLDLLPNTDLSPSGTQYDFTIRYGSGTVLRKQHEVPDSSSYWFVW